MPVHWTVSHPQRLVVAVAKDQVTVADIEQYFAGVTADGAMAYRKIFEITHTPMALSEENLKALGQRVMFYAQHGQIGPAGDRREPPTRASPRPRPSPRRRRPAGRSRSSASCMPRGNGWTPSDARGRSPRAEFHFVIPRAVVSRLAHCRERASHGALYSAALAHLRGSHRP